ncbi:hypothetical protein [Cohnella thermotolerans]|uniref:hypothetical protein n=1 Tax=Cohnella thermotolerans TaxID=329858 RepID=UPI0004079577|nr:hypothetical protein [Cohnella thermotolerans]
MTKAEAMDKLMDAYEKGIGSSEIIRIVHQVFHIDLESVPDLPTPPRAAIDAYLEQVEGQPSGADIRQLLNRTFRINLDALSALEGSRISLFSKNQWMVRHERDLFVVHTGTGDVDVRISPTNCYVEQTGSGEWPGDLSDDLIALGFRYEENTGSYYYSNPAGEPVPDAFKGQTMSAIRKAVASLSHL